MKTSRRAVIGGAIGAAGALAAPSAFAAEFTYRGWRFDTDAVSGKISDALKASFEAQIDIVESIKIKDEIKTFFRSVPCFVDLSTPGGPGAYGEARKRMILSTTPQPPENPVFLHELIHAWHHQVLPGGFGNAEVIAQWKAARGSGQFPPNAYMLQNEREYLAMCASVVLWGKAARPPMTRDNVKTKLPGTYAWVVETFRFEV
jgi:hypothetical protein